MNSFDMDFARLAEAIRDIKFTMLTTVNEDGSMQSRPMAALKLAQGGLKGRLCFFSKKATQKVYSIQHDQHVNLSYVGEGNGCFVSVSGRAQISSDPAQMNELWDPSLSSWFPQGLEEPGLSLITVEVESAEIWDFSGGPLRAPAVGQHLDLNHRQ